MNTIVSFFVDPDPAGHHPKGWFDFVKHRTVVFYFAQDDDEGGVRCKFNSPTNPNLKNGSRADGGRTQ